LYNVKKQQILGRQMGLIFHSDIFGFFVAFEKNREINHISFIHFQNITVKHIVEQFE